MRIQNGVIPDRVPDHRQVLPEWGAVSWGCPAHSSHTMDAPPFEQSEAQAQYCFATHGDHDHAILHVLTRQRDNTLLLRAWKTEWKCDEAT